MPIQQNPEPWSSSQLMEPDTLASLIKNNKVGSMLILSIGPDAIIKGSVDIGPTNDSKNLKKLKNYLKKVSKEKEIVIYCGCCPFDKCPNIRPAFTALKDAGFKNSKLLNLPKNIKVDWIDKGYPVKE